MCRDRLAPFHSSAITDDTTPSAFRATVHPAADRILKSTVQFEVVDMFALTDTLNDPLANEFDVSQRCDDEKLALPA